MYFLKEQARRTAMDRSNIGNSWNREKTLFLLRSIAAWRVKNQNTHLQIIISMDTH